MTKKDIFTAEQLEELGERVDDCYKALHTAKEKYWAAARHMEIMEEAVRVADKALQDFRDKISWLKCK